MHSLNVDGIIRGGLRRYTDQLGHLWNSLAGYYVRSGLFDRARDIYEEAIQTVTTVRDFSQVFDAYAQFEELSLSKVMELLERNPNPTEDQEIDVELRMARFEYLMERRLLLLNSVLLRQNPHNVAEWHKRVELYEGKPHEIINTYTEAVHTVQPKLAVGKLYTLWVAFAKFYETNKQLADARVVFEKAVQVDYLKVDELASVWCEWAEMEIRQEQYEEALRIMQRATAMPKRKVAYHDDTETVQMRVYKSLKLWSMYADLEESFGTFKTCKQVYDRIIDLATVCRFHNNAHAGLSKSPQSTIIKRFFFKIHHTKQLLRLLPVLSSGVHRVVIAKTESKQQPPPPGGLLRSPPTTRGFDWLIIKI